MSLMIQIRLIAGLTNTYPVNLAEHIHIQRSILLLMYPALQILRKINQFVFLS